MTERPPRLHLVATLPIWASEVLTATEKIVWYHTWLLDRAPSEGCYMSARSLGARTGLSTRTVERIRARLQTLGLLMQFPRVDAVQPGWVAVLKARYVPISRTLRGATREAPSLAVLLDAHLAHTDGAPPSLVSVATPDTDDGELPSPVRSPPRHQSVPPPVRRAYHPPSPVTGEAAGLGGATGGAPTLSSSGELPLPPAVTEAEKQVGVGAHAPKLQVGERPASELEAENWAQIRALKKRAPTAEELRDRLDERRRHLGLETPA